MSVASDNVVIGKIGAPYGVKGWVKINSYTQDFTGVFDYSPWILGGKKTIRVDQWRVHNKGLIAKLIGVENRDDAESIKNLEISVTTEQLPQLDSDDFYWRDLVGMQVITTQGYHLGVVKELFETGANDVMLISAKPNDAFGQRERMVPYLYNDVVKQVDVPGNTITVDWDPGF